MPHPGEEVALLAEVKILISNAVQNVKEELQAEIKQVRAENEELRKQIPEPVSKDQVYLKTVEPKEVEDAITNRISQIESVKEVVIKEPTQEEVDKLNDRILTHYELQRSTYDACFFVFTHPIGKLASSFLLFITLLHLILEILVIYVLFNTFGESPFNGEVVEGYTWWRLNVAHDFGNVASVNDVSLASRVCALHAHSSLEFSTSQAQDVADIIEYMDSNSGAIMCSIALLLWLVVCAAEMRQTAEFFLATAVLPRGPMAWSAGAGERRIGVDKVEWMRLTQISMQRHIFLFCVAIVRMVLAFLLCAAGLMFLLYTKTVGDLILNAMALAFVLATDEQLFDAFAPQRSKTLIQLTEPLRLPSFGKFHGIGAYAITGFFCTFVVLIIMTAHFLPAEQNSRHDALMELCPFKTDNHFGGNVLLWPDNPANWNDRESYVDEFAYTYNRIGVISWSQTQRNQGDKKQSFREKHIKEIVDGHMKCTSAHSQGKECELPADPVNDPFFSRRKYVLREQDERNTLDWNERSSRSLLSTAFHGYSGCKDLVNKINGTSVWHGMAGQMYRKLMKGHFFDVLGIDFNDCAELKKYCELNLTWTAATRQTIEKASKDARTWCPETCGCNRPDGHSFAMIRHGCPAQCPVSDKFQEVTATAPCEDTTPGSSTHTNYMARVAAYKHYANLLVMSEGKASVNSPYWLRVAATLAANTTHPCDAAKKIDICHTQNGMSFEYVRSIRFFCPVTCECHRLVDAYDCPRKCSGKFSTLAAPGAGGVNGSVEASALAGQKKVMTLVLDHDIPAGGQYGWGSSA